ncbi:zinc finger protein 654-like [Hippocampus zosterae]|uniref:zinc finger protein 654-like n=1 Tax=Hippocampus zosterae TaxID=109293 RepID=UPI00223D322A|nr:zinc finger protein 654-like [Hippocampus zosterae]
MADSESDVETEGLELALESLCSRYCSDVSALKSKDYCSGFCELVEAYTGQWQVPLPQLKVLQTALCGFTKATARFPDDCQHVHNILSRLALSIFELLLFFSKEEFGEKPLKDILDSYQACHTELLRHRNVYLQHARLIIKAGGPWENQVLQAILKETDLPSKEVDDYLSSELPVFLELRIRYLQVCERIQEAMALAKVCLENHKPGKHLYLHQAYLTCLYKASLHEHLHKQMAQIDGRDAVEIICNTEQVEKDELLLSLCKVFLAQQLHNGDMYHIWDLAFIWSRLHLRTHPSMRDFLTECTRLAYSAKNVRAIFPFIKIVSAELGRDGVQVCMELCARALQLCDEQADDVAQSLICKTIAFLLPGDLEIGRACALLVFCLERSLDAYRTVRLLYKHPDQETHPHRSLVPTNVRFKIMQMLKGRLSFDPEFWSILALRTRCLELIDDKVMKDALINEMSEDEEEEECCDEALTSTRGTDFYAQHLNASKSAGTKLEKEPPIPEHSSESRTVSLSSHAPVKKRKWRRRLQRKVRLLSDEDVDQGDDPEFMYNLKPSSSCNKSAYSLRRNHTRRENCTPGKLPLNRKREYLSRCVKSQILKRKGKKKRWLQGLPLLEAPPQPAQEKVVVLKGKKRGRKPAHRLELSYPDNEISVPKGDSALGEKTDTEGAEGEMPHPDNHPQSVQMNVQAVDVKDRRGNCGPSRGETSPLGAPSAEPPIVSPAVEADPELDGPRQELHSSAIELMHSYHLRSTNSDTEMPAEFSTCENDMTEEPPIIEGYEKSNIKVKAERTWREKVRRGQKYACVTFYCHPCKKNYKGLNVLRHFIAHFKRRNRCIICGKCFQHLVVGKKHIWEHVEEMCKNHKDAEAEGAQTTNGTTSNQLEAPPNENQTPSEEPRKKLGKVKVSSLSREDRIMRNLRIALRKLQAQSKKLNKDAAAVPLDFEDEQVVIQDDLVIIKAPAAPKQDEADAAGENGYDVVGKFVLCPSSSCDRVFLKHCSNLTKHAVRNHLNDDQVLEKTFVWAKHKCTFCSRNFQFVQYYKEHIRRHDHLLPHFCFHAQCDQRFLTSQELRAHMSTHDPFSAVCAFANCNKQFSDIVNLFDHEWRHYVPPPQRDDLGRQQRQSDEAPWKQRVKVEERWSQNKQVNQEKPGVVKSTSGNLAVEANVPDSAEVCLKAAEPIQKPINGFEEAKQCHGPKGSKRATSKKAHHKKKFRFTCRNPVPDPLNVKDMENNATMAEGVASKWEEPLIAQHKTFNTQEPTYAPFYKTYFTRLPPSTYMDESQLSMRKRRVAAEEAHTQSQSCSFYTQTHFSVRYETHESKGKREPKIRHRCEKCLSSFDSVQELQNHKALNTCSALFGFDSDDES